ncbi:hypothetical protein [Nonomuraea sp. NPDC049480]|uniref:hypothetical protein n=1 Tax=Nonomuraea sp. NPDC049480 TaxID=3364353 RepID=UPI0037A72C17
MNWWTRPWSGLGRPGSRTPAIRPSAGCSPRWPRAFSSGAACWRSAPGLGTLLGHGRLVAVELAGHGSGVILATAR